MLIVTLVLTLLGGCSRGHAHKGDACQVDRDCVFPLSCNWTKDATAGTCGNQPSGGNGGSGGGFETGGNDT